MGMTGELQKETTSGTAKAPDLTQFVSQQDRRGPHGLFDDPGAFCNLRDELEGVVPLAVKCGAVAKDKPCQTGVEWG